MKQSIISACLLFTGLVIGWWLRDSVPATGLLRPELPVSASSTEAVIRHHSKVPASVATPQPESVPTIAPTIAATKPFEVSHFEQLLNQREFDLAVAYYENALEVDGGFETLLKPRLEQYLGVKLQDCSDDAFVDLAELWLETYYEDISVLLLLAENQRFCGSAEEAARTLLIADTYALAPGQKASVSAAVASLIEETDKSLSREQRWIELLNFYEFLQIIDLGTNRSRLRMASLYQLMGELQRSRELLRELKENDDGLNSDWTAAIDLQWDKTIRQVSADDPPIRSIPLTRRGDHFLLAASINDMSQVILMIDTGASVTTLSRASFDQINSKGLGYQGSRLFNTANGITRGDVYLTTSISLGNTRISSVELAVLDYDSSPGIDGVLGMNVLRNYRFEIDQDKDILYLRPRR